MVIAPDFSYELGSYSRLHASFRTDLLYFAFYYIAMIMHSRGKHETALEFFSINLAFFMRNKARAANNYANMGWILAEMGEYDLSIEHIVKALDIKKGKK